MKRIFAFILLFLMLAGCGQQEKTDSLAAEDVSKAPVPLVSGSQVIKELFCLLPLLLHVVWDYS